MTLYQIMKFIEKFSKTVQRPSNGYCLLTSDRFVGHLKHDKASVLSGFLSDKEHCWIEVWGDFDTILVDFTADQFGYPPLIVGPVTEMFNKYHYQYEMR